MSAYSLCETSYSNNALVLIENVPGNQTPKIVSSDTRSVSKMVVETLVHKIALQSHSINGWFVMCEFSLTTSITQAIWHLLDSATMARGIVCQQQISGFFSWGQTRYTMWNQFGFASQQIWLNGKRSFSDTTIHTLCFICLFVIVCFLLS